MRRFLCAAFALALLLLAGCAEIDEMVQTVLPAPIPSGFVEKTATPMPIVMSTPSATAQSTPGATATTALAKAALPTPEPTPRPLVTSQQEGEWFADCEAFTVTVTETMVETSRAYIAEVEVRDMNALRGAYAYDTFDSRRKEKASEMAKRNSAVLAINGDYYSYRSDGIIVRNGVMERNRPERDMLAIFDDGRMEVINEAEADPETLINEGLLHTFSFGPQLVQDGAARDDVTKSNVWKANPRTGIGLVEPGHFVFIVVDGRQDDSLGLTLTEFAQLFVNEGCEIAYNLDGGATSEMLFMGEVISVPSGNLAVGEGVERTISDILYLAVPQGDESE